MKYIHEIENKYQFRIPKEYLSLYERGCFNLNNPKHYSDLINDQYLWVNELEWIHPSKIITYRCEEQIKKQFVPFAFNGAGELWCWAPNENNVLGVPIVLCDNIGSGTFEAPNFISLIFQQILMLIEYEKSEYLKPYLKRYLRDFNNMFSESWLYELTRANKIKEINVSEGYYELKYKELVNYDRHNEDFKWHHS